MAEIKTLGPVGLNPLGEYNSETEYEKLDVVLYQGSSYVALQTVQGQVPTNTEYWQKLVTGGMDIIDNLESEDTQKALSANQGRILNESIFLDGINYTENYDSTSKTTYYITEIPYKDTKGNINKWKLGVGQDNIETVDSLESTIDFAKRKNASICINGGLFHMSSGTNKPYGILIQNGEILYEEEITTGEKVILGIKEDGSFMTFDAMTTSAEEVLEAGCVNALVSWKVLIQNGLATENPGTSVAPRQVICRKTNGDYLIFTCDGRTKYDLGMSETDIQRILLEREDIDFAFNLDGGGSTSTVIDMQKINKNIDNQTDDRPVQNFLYMSKEHTKKDIDEIYGIVSKLRQEVIKKNINIIDIWKGYLKLYSDGLHPGIEFYENNETSIRSGKIHLNMSEFAVRKRPDLETDEAILFRVTDDNILHKGVALGNFMDYITSGSANTNLDEILKAGVYQANGSTTGAPQSSGNFIILHFNLNSSKANRVQFAFPQQNTEGYIYCRRKLANSDIYTDWQVIGGCIANTTVKRPTTNLKVGQMYFDTTLGKPIWYNGTNWVDATGTQV